MEEILKLRLELIKKIFKKATLGSALGSDSDAIYFAFKQDVWYIEKLGDFYWIYKNNEEIGHTENFDDILSFLNALKKIGN